jgi:Na+-transporting NADH:ubiquinone oxidoreductase subunit NqrC
MIILIIILALMVVVLGYTTFNLLRKVEKQEDELDKRQDVIVSYQTYINSLGEIIYTMTERIDKIDVKGTFKSDDEVGFFFQRLKTLSDMLKPYNIKL